MHDDLPKAQSFQAVAPGLSGPCHTAFVHAVFVVGREVAQAGSLSRRHAFL